MAYLHPAILVVHDDPAVRSSLQEFFRTEGYGVDTAVNGRQALDKLKGGFHPCIIILDVVVPEIDGCEFRKEQLADPVLADIPVIAFSGAIEADDAKRLGAVAFFRRPADLGTVISLVRQHCLK